MSESGATRDDLGFRFTAMASEGEVRLCGLDLPAAQRCAELAIGEIRRIEHKYSRYRADSVIARINASAGHGTVEIDEETAGLLDYAERLHGLSGGKFDITSGALRRAWDFKKGALPEPGALERILTCVGHQHVHRSRGRVGLGKVGMELDFGGFGKEYAVDRAATLLHEAGVRHGFLNVGGDLRAIGPREDGEPWSIGIQHPRRANAVLASVDISVGALATSGDYERFFERDGVRYCHILDPHTGWPIRHWQSISVAAPVCLGAGALTTIAMLMETRALAFLDDQAATYLAIDARGTVTRTL